MSQILDSINNENKSILCCYVNATSKIQIARITNISNWYFERVVFPGQRLVFEALAGALLEIHSGMMASAILSDTIPCERLQVTTGSDGNSNSTAQAGSHDVKNREEAEEPEEEPASQQSHEAILAAVE